MRNDGGGAPSAAEVAEQLARMLSVPRFLSTRVQSKILRFVALRSLAGQEISEPELAEAVFGVYDPETHKVRQNTSLLRARIAEYYANEGKDDLVRLGLLPGAGYRLAVSYNTEARVVRLFQKGLLHQKDFSRESLQASDNCFQEAWDLNPGNGAVLSAHADTRLLQRMEVAMLGMPYEEQSEHRGFLESSVVHLKESLSPESWYAEIVNGAHSLFDCDWNEAAESFESALRTNPAETERSLWYALFLVWRSDFPKARGILENRLNVTPLDMGVNLACAALYYLIGDYDEALICALNAYRPDGKGPEACLLVHSLVLLEIGNVTEARIQFARFTGSLIGDDFFAFSLEKRSRRLFTGFMTAFVARSQGVASARAFLAHDLSVVADASRSNVKYRLLHGVNAPRRPPPIQMAIAYAALGRPARALICMRRATKCNDRMLLNFGHLIPLFRPLWKHPRFREIWATLQIGLICGPDEE